MQFLELNECHDLVAKLAKQNNCDAEVLTVSGAKFNANYYKGNLDQFSLNNTRSMGIRVINGKGEGSAYTESLTKEDIENTFEEAFANSKILQKKYTPKLVGPAEYKEMPELFHADLEKVSIEDRLEHAKQLEAGARDTSEKIESAPSKLGQYMAEISVFNTNGVNAYAKSNGLFAYAFPLAKDGDDLCQQVEVGIAQNYKDLDTYNLGVKCAKKSLAGLGAKVPKTGTYKVIMDPYAHESMMGLFLGHFSAKSVDDGLSLLNNKIGKTIFSDKISITDNPFLKGSMNSSPFDSEGSPSKVTTLVEKGVLKTYLTNSVYAEKLGLENTANASRSPSSELGISATNTCVAPGDKTFDELVNSYEETIVVTNIKGYSGFNGVSGDFSLQSEGVHYVNGQKQSGLKDFVISGNILDMYKNVEHVGNDLLVTYQGIEVPSIAVGNLSIAGQ